jgi:hypothetical protein
MNKFYQDYYMEDELFGNEHYIDAPPVPVACIYGINIPTEVAIVLSGKAPRGNAFLLDRTPLEIECLETYEVRDGVIYETMQTPQPLIQQAESGRPVQ